MEFATAGRHYYGYLPRTAPFYRVTISVGMPYSLYYRAEAGLHHAAWPKTSPMPNAQHYQFHHAKPQDITGSEGTIAHLLIGD